MATPAEQVNTGFTDAQGVYNSPRDTYIYKDFSLFFGRDRTESPIDVLFFTDSIFIENIPFAFFNSFSSEPSFVVYYCGDDGDVVLSSE